jgi:putative ABC transport system permease protein
MPTKPRLRFRRPRFEEELTAELRAHLDHRADDLVRQGLPSDEARRRARVELGAIETYKDECRRTRRFASLRALPESTWRDGAYAARRLVAAPVFTVFAIVSLALGLAVTTTAYAVVHAMLWRPTGIADPTSLLVVTRPGERGRPWRQALSDPDADDLMRDPAVAGRIAAAGLFSESLSDGPGADIVNGEVVTGAYFEVVGVAPARGRLLRASDDQSSAPAVVVLGDRLWRTRYGSDPGIVGRTLRFGGQPVDVVGVAPASFAGFRSGAGTDLWIARAAARQLALWTSFRDRPGDRAQRALTVLIRRASDRDGAALGDLVHAVGASLDGAYPRRVSDGPHAGELLPPRDWRVEPFDVAMSAETGPMTTIGRAAIALVALVLVVACSNLANLMLARGTTRAHEFDVRRALGASRARLVRALATEALLIAAAGGLAAWALTRALFAAASIDLPIRNGQTVQLDLALHPVVLAAGATALLLSLVVFGLLPALRLTRGDVRPTLGHAIGVSGVPTKRLWRSTRWQVATTTTLFLIAAVMVRVVIAERRHEPGIDADRLAVAVVVFDQARGQDAAYARRIVDDVLARLRRNPDIESASASMGVPFGLTITPYSQVEALGTTSPTGARRASAFTLPTTPGIFGTLGVPIIAGRALAVDDDRTGAAVAVVSALEARRLFGRADAGVVGRQIAVQFRGRSPALTLRIVGVARDTDTGRAMQRDDGLVYLPMSQAFSPGLAFMARAANPERAAAALRLAIGQTDRNLGVWTAGPAPVVLAGGYALLRILSRVTMGLAGIALLLSMVGLYGVLAQVIARQTREMGVRLALGATTGQIRRLVLSQGVRPVAVGLAMGLAVGLVVRAGLRGMGMPVEVVDASAFLVVAAGIGLAALAACYVPARRASRVDPKVALRDL